MMSGSIRWDGVISGTVTPFLETGSLDWSSLERHLEFLVDTKLVGLISNSMMAEGLHLLPTERDAILEFTVQRVNGKIPVIATIYGVNTSDAAEQAYRAARAGASAVLVFPHPAFAGEPLDLQLPVDYFRAIWERASLPMMVFRLAAASGPSFGIEALKRLSDVPGVVAVKDSAAEAGFYDGEGAEFLRHNSPLKILVDNDLLMLEFLRRGAHGATSMCATIDPDRYVRAFERRNDPSGDDTFETLKALPNALFKAPKRDFRARLKVALASDGLIADPRVRPPLQALSGEERDKIIMALQLSRRGSLNVERALL